MTSLRAFIAIALPEALHHELADLQRQLQRLRAPVTWTTPSNIHLTLKFLGSIPSSTIPTISTSLATLAEGVPTFELVCAKVGAFPSLTTPRVIWVGVNGEGVEPLLALQSRLESALANVGIPPDERRFHPHLTLGRLRDPSAGRALGQALDGLRPVWQTSIPVTHLTLFQSTLRPQGAQYDMLTQTPLRPTPH